MILDGKKCAESTKARLKVIQERHPQYRKPHLCVIQVGNDERSNTYVRLKQKDCEEVGFICNVVKYDENDSLLERKLRRFIAQMNIDDNVDGIMVQLPIPGWLGKEPYMVQDILNSIAESKDVDGLGRKPADPWNHQKYQGHNPCTPYGILMLMNYYDIPIEGRRAVVIGRSDIVGKPVAQMLLHYGATVTVCHSKTPMKTMMDELMKADIIVSAVGKPGLIDEACLGRLTPNDPVTIIDVGTTPINGKLVGDFDDSMLQHDANGLQLANWTPVPGGVGPMTRVGLLCNVHDAFQYHLRKEGKYNAG